MVGFLDFLEIYESAVRACVDEALSGAESTRFRNMLKKAIVAFQYRKKNGKLRTARGTLQKKLLPKYKEERRPRNNPKNFVYFDVDKGDFRCFARDGFIGIVKDGDSGEDGAGDNNE